METLREDRIDLADQVKPRCPVFHDCGGCTYQHINYLEELKIKEKKLQCILNDKCAIDKNVIEPIVPSPKVYHYRNRLDLKMLRTKKGRLFMGFSPGMRAGQSRYPFGVVDIEACYIAQEQISQFIPKLKLKASDKFPENYKQANIVVRTGDDGRIFWGGIGRRSLHLSEEDYLWTKIQGRKIFYSLDTFFQANLSILPQFVERIQSLNIWDRDTCLYDLYGGVGFLGMSLYDHVKKVILVEENPASLKLACYNIGVHQLENFHIIDGRVEDKLTEILDHNNDYKQVALIDPPRDGLSVKALSVLANSDKFGYILYLSCNPDALARDLESFLCSHWKIRKIIPFDFFPRTAHLETLTVLKTTKLTKGELTWK